MTTDVELSSFDGDAGMSWLVWPALAALFAGMYLYSRRLSRNES